MKTFSNIIHNKTFPLKIYDSNGYLIYYEDSEGWRVKNMVDRIS